MTENEVFKIMQDEKYYYYYYNDTVYKVKRDEKLPRNLVERVTLLGEKYDNPFEFITEKGQKIERTKKGNKKEYHIGAMFLSDGKNNLIESIYNVAHCLSKESYDALIKYENWVSVGMTYYTFVNRDKSIKFTKENELAIIKNIGEKGYKPLYVSFDEKTQKPYAGVPLLYDPKDDNIIDVDDVKYGYQKSKYDMDEFFYWTAMHAMYMICDTSNIAGYFVNDKQLIAYDLSGNPILFYHDYNELKYVKQENAECVDTLLDPHYTPSAAKLLHEILNGELSKEEVEEYKSDDYHIA